MGFPDSNSGDHCSNFESNIPTINRDRTWNPQQTRAEVAESTRLASQFTVGRVEFGPSLNPPPSNSGVASNIKEMASAFYRPGRAPEVKRGTLVLGMVGAAGAGKDTVVAHLIEKFGAIRNDCAGMYIKRYAFADALKCEFFDWLQALRHVWKAGLVNPVALSLPSGTQVYSRDEKLKWVNASKDTYRTILQYWGKEYRREQDSTYWVRQLLERVRADRPQVACVTDVRFLNEVSICHVTVRVERIDYELPAQVAAHVSESELRDYVCDYTIRAQTGDIEGLQRQAEGVFEQILEKFHVH